MAGEDWTRSEVEAVVADYLEMLAAVFLGQPPNKSERRRNLLQVLGNRNESAVERKRGNVSAVMVLLGYHYLPGYKPLPNYQKLLESVVLAQLEKTPWLDEAAMAAVQLPAVSQSMTDFSKVKTSPPKLALGTNEPSPRKFLPIRRDYLEREARNRSLGRAGEEFVVEFERWRLMQIGEASLANRVDWVSQTEGDGLGYDVLSFDAFGEKRFIEVKTTAYGVATPFFVTDNELAFADSKTEQFHLYRVFDFRQAPKLFDLPGKLATHCLLDPVTYRASFS
ncbi:DUF3883 domain-containing protein [Polaromonas sp. P5_D5]